MDRFWPDAAALESFRASTEVQLRAWAEEKDGLEVERVVLNALSGFTP